MAEYTLEQDRLISGKGVFKLQADAKKFRHAYILLDVVRDPKNRYINRNYNPVRGKYAFLTFRKDGYVVSQASMEFEKQRFDVVSDITSQNLIAIKCAYDGVLQTFVNLSIALGSTPGGAGLMPLSKTDLIKDYDYLSLNWDEMLINCYADTAVQVRWYSLLHDSCSADRDDKKEPPPPPPPRPKVPAGTPLSNISPPYDSTNSDSGNTSPFPGDTTPPVFAACSRVRVTFRFRLQGMSADQTSEVIVFAPVGESITIKSGDAKVAQMPHRGQSPTGSSSEQCLAYQLRDLVSFTSNIISITLVGVAQA